ncbi:ABC transporter substrate-binding protein [Oscillospiraceae bacterium LTW-04]|nr:ABC transporter substrate-binding protein [Oscillospiraceae bacterium MB24-C1]
MKKLIPLVLALTLIFCGCGAASSSVAPSLPATSDVTSSTAPSQTEPAAPITVAALKGPTAMGMVKLMADDADQNRYAFNIAGAVDEITPKLVQGDIQIAAVPANLASVLYNNTKGQVQVLAINTLGVLYIVENGEDIHTVEDLRGKTILSAGKGATPEYALNFMLEQNGIDPEKDVTIEYKAEHAECAAVLDVKEKTIAMLPQPFVTAAQMKNNEIRVTLDLNREWAQAQEKPSSLITGVVVARTDFIKTNPQAVADFLTAYKASVDYVTDPNNIEAASDLVAHYEIVSSAIAQKAIPQCNITFIAGEEMRERLSGYLAILFDQNPKAVGGALPDENFYFVG